MVPIPCKKLRIYHKKKYYTPESINLAKENPPVLDIFDGIYQERLGFPHGDFVSLPGQLCDLSIRDTKNSSGGGCHLEVLLSRVLKSISCDMPLDAFGILTQNTFLSHWRWITLPKFNMEAKNDGF